MQKTARHRIDAHPAFVTGDGCNSVLRHGARIRFFRRRHRVFEVEYKTVRRQRTEFIEHSLLIGRHEQKATP